MDEYYKLLHFYEECPRAYFYSLSAYLFQRCRILSIIADAEEW